MPSHLRLPTLAVAAVSIGLNLAIIGTAGRTLNVYMTQKETNAYFLPVWTAHFDMRGLHALIGTSASIVVLNAVLVLALSVSALPANVLVLATSACGTILSIVAIAFSTVLNHRAPGRDTLQTWSCMWRDVQGNDVPRQFNTLCNETRFAFYTTLPSLVLQLALLTLAISAVTSRGGSKASPRRGVRLDEEKDLHELTPQKQQRLDAGFYDDSKTGSPKSMQDSVKVLAERH